MHTIIKTHYIYEATPTSCVDGINWHNIRGNDDNWQYTTVPGVNLYNGDILGAWPSGCGHYPADVTSIPITLSDSVCLSKVPSNSLTWHGEHFLR